MNYQTTPRIPKLEDIQANILKGHGREEVKCLFISFNAHHQKIKFWISQFADKYITSAHQQREQSIAYKQQKDKKNYKDTEVVATLYLSRHFYNKTLIPKSLWPKDASFLQGMSHGVVRSEMKDIPSTSWENAYQKPIDMLIVLASTHLQVIAKTETDIRNSLDQEKLGEIEIVESGKIIRNKAGLPIEHFGYVDGISDLPILDDNGELIDDHWKHLLVQEDAQQGRYGSYLVFRKLKQDVELFEQLVDKLVAKTGLDRALAYAQIMGRFKDGTPLIASNKPLGWNIKELKSHSSKFKYFKDPHGQTCPFHAHIRKVNPRSDLPGEEQIHIARRGIPYGDPDNDLIEKGLLFMSFQASISKQYRIIEKDWSNNMDFSHTSTGMDPINGREVSWYQSPPQQWNTESGPIEHKFESIANRRKDSSIVRLKGGCYLYAPSISWLKNINRSYEELRPIWEYRKRIFKPIGKL